MPLSKLVTIATKGSKFRPMLSDSCYARWVPLDVLQTDEPWVSFVHNKVKRLYELLKPLEWDTVVYADCSDVFLTGWGFLPDRMPPCGWLYSGETNCFPWPERHKKSYDGKLPYPYPNAGVWAATREAFMRNMEAMLAFDDPYEEQGRSIANGNCDQLLAHEMVIRGYAEVDSRGSWCLNLYGVPNPIAELHIREVWPKLVHGSSYENKGRTWELKRKLGL